MKHDVTLKEHLAIQSKKGWPGKVKKHGAAGARDLMRKQAKKYWDSIKKPEKAI